MKVGFRVIFIQGFPSLFDYNLSFPPNRLAVGSSSSC